MSFPIYLASHCAAELSSSFDCPFDMSKPFFILVWNFTSSKSSAINGRIDLLFVLVIAEINTIRNRQNIIDNCIIFNWLGILESLFIRHMVFQWMVILYKFNYLSYVHNGTVILFKIRHFSFSNLCKEHIFSMLHSLNSVPYNVRVND